MPATGSGVQKWVIRNNSVGPLLTVRQVGDSVGKAASLLGTCELESSQRRGCRGGGLYLVTASHWLSLANETVNWWTVIPVEYADKSVFNLSKKEILHSEFSILPKNEWLIRKSCF